MNAQGWLYVVGLGLSFIGTVIAATWKLSTRFGGIETRMLLLEQKVELIMTNHLVHLPEEVAKALRDGKTDV